MPAAGFEDRFQKEASLCSSAIRPSLVKVSDQIDFYLCIFPEFLGFHVYFVHVLL